MDAEKREIYDKLGPEAAAQKVPVTENTMLLEVKTHNLANSLRQAQ